MATDPLLVALVVVAAACGLCAVLLLWPQRQTSMSDDAPRDEELSALPVVHGLAALHLNVLPRQHDRTCSCNGRALVWSRDSSRQDAWIGSCRRCGIPRLDVVAGITLER